MVEIDPGSRKAVRKLKGMGRYKHEDAYCMPDGKTIYLTNDDSPAFFFKFVATTKNQYEKGQLYVYQQSEDGVSGKWLPMPRDTIALEKARETAAGLGATMFLRHEWLTRVGTKLYISETGNDSIDLNKWVKLGGVPATYYRDHHHLGNQIYDDPHGRVLAFDVNRNSMNSLLEGGMINEQDAFSNPDCITSIHKNGKDFLVMNEDIIGTDRGRTFGKATAGGYTVNEVYVLDLSIKEPQRSDLKRFMVSPKGSESTGGIFTKDGKNYFVNIQHPDETNQSQFNQATSVVLKEKPKSIKK
jgi:secreted PhoX family phosphatase